VSGRRPNVSIVTGRGNSTDDCEILATTASWRPLTANPDLPTRFKRFGQAGEVDPAPTPLPGSEAGRETKFRLDAVRDCRSLMGNGTASPVDSRQAQNPDTLTRH
jgi:hypothetical protein